LLEPPRKGGARNVGMEERGSGGVEELGEKTGSPSSFSCPVKSVSSDEPAHSFFRTTFNPSGNSRVGLILDPADFLLLTRSPKLMGGRIGLHVGVCACAAQIVQERPG